MYRLQTIAHVITMITIFLCCCLVVVAQSNSEEEQTEVELLPKPENPIIPKSEILETEPSKVFKDEKEDQKADGKKEKKEQKDLDERSTFDFSLPGDNRTQSLALFFERPLNSKGIEGKISGNYYLTLEKPTDIPKDLSFWNLYKESTPKWKLSPNRTHYTLKVVPQARSVSGDILI